MITLKNKIKIEVLTCASCCGK